MHTTALPPGFVPKSTALVNTFASHKSSNALVKRHLQRNTFRTVYGIEIGSTAVFDEAKCDVVERRNSSDELSDSKLVVEEAVWFVEPLAFKTGHKIVLKCERLSLDANEDRLKRILINLISNAIKFSPANSTIEVSVSVVHGLALFSVKDEGFGIPADRLDSIFQTTRRVARKAAGEVLGSGLGLPICKELVEGLGGQIGVGSSESGCYFWFTVPLA